MKLQCPICQQEFPKFDQRGFRNAGFTSHYNRCLERQREQLGEHDQLSSRASRFARAIRRRLLPAQQQQNQLISSIQLSNFQAGDEPTLQFNRTSIPSSTHRYYQRSENINSSEFLFHNHYYQQQQSDFNQNGNEESSKINDLSSPLLINESLSVMGSLPTTTMTTSPILINDNKNDHSMNMIHNIRPCRSLPILDNVNPTPTPISTTTTTSPSSTIVYSTVTSTLSDIITDTVSMSSEWISSPTLSSSMTMSPHIMNTITTTTNTITLLAECPMITHYFDHNNNKNIIQPSLSMTQDSFIPSHPIQTNTSSSSSSSLSSSTTIQPTPFIDYDPSIISSLMATNTNTTTTTTSTSTTTIDHSSSSLSSMTNIPSHFFNFMDPTMNTSTPSSLSTVSSSITTTHFIPTTMINNDDMIYNSSFYYCQYCQSQDGFHLSTCSLMTYIITSNNNNNVNNN